MNPSDDTAAPGQKMKNIVELYGEEIFLSKSRLSAAVRDMYSRDVKLKNLLLNAIEYDVPAKLRNLRDMDESTRESRIHLIADGFSSDFTIPREAAYKPINCFAHVFGYGAFGLPTPAPPPPVTAPPQPQQARTQRTQQAQRTQPKIGGIIPLGGYAWRVLDVRNGLALLLSDKIIEKRKYNERAAGITWATCALRGYLNGAFYQKLPIRDRVRIEQIETATNNNPWYGTRGGVVTKEMIFLLSIEEVVKYFGDSGQLKNRTPDAWWLDDQYNLARIAVDETGTAWWWWLRSPGYNSGMAACVDVGGGLGVGGDHYYHVSASGGVRPALWLNLQFKWEMSEDT